jgi:hypothetical protein
MRRFRFTIGWLMMVVLVLAISFAALRNTSETWAGVILLLGADAKLVGQFGA